MVERFQLCLVINLFTNHFSKVKLPHHRHYKCKQGNKIIKESYIRQTLNGKLENSVTLLMEKTNHVQSRGCFV